MSSERSGRGMATDVDRSVEAAMAAHALAERDYHRTDNGRSLEALLRDHLRDRLTKALPDRDVKPENVSDLASAAEYLDGRAAGLAVSKARRDGNWLAELGATFSVSPTLSSAIIAAATSLGWRP